MCRRLLRSARFHSQLLAIDTDLAALAGKEGCPLCAGALHAASYPRKPRGVPDELENPFLYRRHSFCCASRDCRKRLTPPSVRFLHRRVYVSVVVVIAAVLAHGLTRSRIKKLCSELGVDPKTLERWRQWWQESVPQADFWTELRGRLDCPVDPLALPGSLLEKIEAESESERILSFLFLLAPLSHSALMRRRFARVA